MSCGCAGHDPDCTCCKGVTAITPMEVTNRPGLDALRYRVGTHARFFETMQAKLSSAALEVERFDDAGQRSTEKIRPLEGLTTRERGDPAIAVLDAWATVADVLSFYTERVANEGFLRTATERRSVLEIARLVGYAPRPGVAGSVYLAYTLEDGHEDVTLKAGTRAQSVPAPGELPQSFETSEDFVAQARLSAIRPRLSRPQFRTPEAKLSLYLKGIVSALKVGDRLRLIFEQADASGQTSFVYRVNTVTLETDRDRTTVKLEAVGLKAAKLADAPVITVVKSPLELLSALQIPGASKVATAVKAQLEALRADDGARLLSGSRAALSNLNAQTQLVGNNAKLADALSMTALHLETFAAANDALETPGRTSDPTLRETNARAAIAHLESVRVRAEAAGQAELATYAASAAAAAKNQFVTPSVTEILEPLLLEPSRQVASAAFLEKNPENLLRPRDDMATRAFLRVFPRAKDTAYSVLEAAPAATNPSLSGVERFQVTAGVYGHNAPLTPVMERDPNQDRQLIVTKFKNPPGFESPYLDIPDLERGKNILLDAQYDSIKPGSWIAVVSSGIKDDPVQFRQVLNTESVSPRLYGLSSTVTKLTLDKPWPLKVDEKHPTVEEIVKNTTVFAATDATITLADEPIEGDASDIGGANGMDANGNVSELELNGLYRGLEPGRWVIVQGERLFESFGSEGEIILTPSGVVVAELAMVAEVRHDVSQIVVNGKSRNLPGDTLHTFVRLARPLKWRFKRETVTIFGNVVKSTHGETRAEVLGAGDAAKAFQRFELKQPPLTYLAAPTAVGAASTLEVRVDGLKWLEAPHLAGLGRADRRYTLRTDDDGKTSVVFGDGVRGARLPTGRENITANYRNGIGKPGNVGANRISLLASRPLGVKGVINPIRASGGADRESRDQARRNAPLAVMALDRLVSVQDYEDFARTFAGIGKASAARFDRGGRALVHLTIAGADDIPIDLDSDLYRNLLEALRRNGDADQPVNLDVRELRLLVISARVRIRPEYAWDRVEASLRQRMLEHFGFERRELGQDVTSSEVLSVIQAAPGVEYADLGSVAVNRGLGWIDGEQFAKLEGENPPDSLIQWVPDNPPGDARVVAEMARPKDPTKRNGPILPAQLVTLSPDVPATLTLTEIR